MSGFKETKTRSIVKSAAWRILAFLNSWTVISVCTGQTGMMKAFIMNVSGFFIFFMYERVWNLISFGKYEI